jgi:hypothetical protein
VLLAKKRQLTDEEQAIVDGIGRALLSQAEEQVGAEVGAEDEHRRALAEQNQEQEEFGQQNTLLLEAQQVKEASTNRIVELAEIHNQTASNFTRNQAHLAKVTKDTRKREAQATKFAKDRQTELDQLDQEINYAQPLLEDAINRAQDAAIRFDEITDEMAQMRKQNVSIKSTLSRGKNLLDAQEKTDLQNAQAQITQNLADLNKEIPNAKTQKKEYTTIAKAINDKMHVLVTSRDKIDEKQDRAIEHMKQSRILLDDLPRITAQNEQDFKDDEADLNARARNAARNARHAAENVEDIVDNRPAAPIAPSRIKVIPAREAEKREKTRLDTLDVIQEGIEPIRDEIADIKNAMRAVLKAWELGRQDPNAQDDAGIILGAESRIVKRAAQELDEEKDLPKGSAAQDLAYALPA